MLFLFLVVWPILGALVYVAGGMILEQVCVGTFGAWVKWPFRVAHLLMPIVAFLSAAALLETSP